MGSKRLLVGWQQRSTRPHSMSLRCAENGLLSAAICRKSLQNSFPACRWFAICGRKFSRRLRKKIELYSKFLHSSPCPPLAPFPKKPFGCRLRRGRQLARLGRPLLPFYWTITEPRSKTFVKLATSAMPLANSARTSPPLFHNSHRGEAP